MGIRMAEEAKITDLLMHASEIVTAHLSKNKVPTGELPELIRNVVKSLTAVSTGEAPLTRRSEPAVSIKKSVTPDYIVCLEDGRKLKMLKRHLRTSYNMSPDQYRARWNLFPDYPMVAPNYARKRSKLAKAIGLGTKPSRKRAK